MNYCDAQLLFIRHLCDVLENLETRHPRQVTTDTDDDQDSDAENFDSNHHTFMKRLFKTVKRDVSEQGQTQVKIVKGSAVIPEEAGVQSIGIPPLLSLNNNLSEIPVPIPNTSVVHYSKINTLVHSR